MQCEYQTDMTDEEKQHIKGCRILISGTDKFINYIKDELSRYDFRYIALLTETNQILNYNTFGIIIECIGERTSYSFDVSDIPVIFPFDFIDGAGAIVMFPEDDRSWLEKRNIRQWVAEYIFGYCAFWNMSGCDWLHDSLPLINENLTSESAMQTAARICAGIAANIAVGREVKRFPHFYLYRNLQ